MTDDRKVTCPRCQRRIGVQTRNNRTRVAAHRATATKAPGELPGLYARCPGSGAAVEGGRS